MPICGRCTRAKAREDDIACGVTKNLKRLESVPLLEGEETWGTVARAEIALDDERAPRRQLHSQKMGEEIVAGEPQPARPPAIAPTGAIEEAPPGFGPGAAGEPQVGG